MSDARLVWFFAGRLAMVAPQGAGHLLFHRLSRIDWHKTKCGKSSHERFGELVAVRRDTADLIADPCRFCFPEGDDDSY